MRKSWFSEEQIRYALPLGGGRDGGGGTVQGITGWSLRRSTAGDGNPAP